MKNCFFFEKKLNVFGTAKGDKFNADIVSIDFVSLNVFPTLYVPFVFEKWINSGIG